MVLFICRTVYLIFCRMEKMYHMGFHCHEFVCQRTHPLCRKEWVCVFLPSPYLLHLFEYALKCFYTLFVTSFLIFIYLYDLLVQVDYFCISFELGCLLSFVMALSNMTRTVLSFTDISRAIVYISVWLANASNTLRSFSPSNMLSA